MTRSRCGLKIASLKILDQPPMLGSLALLLGALTGAQSKLGRVFARVDPGSSLWSRLFAPRANRVRLLEEAAENHPVVVGLLTREQDSDAHRRGGRTLRVHVVGPGLLQHALEGNDFSHSGKVEISPEKANYQTITSSAEKENQ
jgi:hypothetical protein